MLSISEILQNVSRYQNRSNKLHQKYANEILGFSPLITKAIGQYMNNSEINDILRKESERLKVDDQLDLSVTLFDMAFEQITPIEKDLIVFRGIQPPLQEDFPGFYTSDKGYVSTSVTLDTTEPFRGESCCLQLILLPKGSKVLFLPNTLSELVEDEYEILLNRNSSFRLLESANFDFKNEEGEVNNVKTVLLQYVPGEFFKPDRIKYFKMLILNKLLEFRSFAPGDLHDFKQFVSTFPDNCQMITRAQFKDLLQFFAKQIRNKILKINEMVKNSVYQWYLFYFILLETYPFLIKGNEDILSLEDRINMDVTNFLNHLCWDLANIILQEGKSLSLFKTLVRFTVPGFRLDLKEGIDVSLLETLYALHPNARDFYNVWAILFRNFNEPLLNFAVTYQIPLNEFFLQPLVLLGNLTLTALLTRLPLTQERIRGPLINLWIYILSQNQIENVQNLKQHGIPFVANDYLSALLEVSSPEIRSYIMS